MLSIAWALLQMASEIILSGRTVGTSAGVSRSFSRVFVLHMSLQRARIHWLNSAQFTLKLGSAVAFDVRPK